jgi:tetratricopeptide (TPR) repeat protein
MAPQTSRSAASRFTGPSFHSENDGRSRARGTHYYTAWSPVPRRKSTHVDDPVAVGERLREARERAGLTQRDLAFPGCSPAYISRIESGDRIPSLQLLRELGRRLSVSEDYLATGANRAAPEDPRLLEAEVSVRLDETEQAQRLYEDVLASPWRKEDQAQALAGLGELAFLAGEPREAITRIERALGLWGESPADRPSLAETLGRSKAMLGRVDEAIEIFESCLAAAESRQDTIEQLRAAVLLANALVDHSEFERAGEILAEKVASAETARDPILRARLYWSQSRLYGMQNDSQRAVRYARRALEIVELAEDDLYTARAHELLAHMELDRNRPEEALRLLRKAWPLLEKRANTIDKAGFRLEEARALAQLDRREEAAALAMEVSGLLSDAKPRQAGRSYTLLGEIYASIGDPERARELYELAIEVLEPTPDRYLVHAYSKLAELLEADGHPDAALSVLKRAMDVRASGAAD